MATLADYLELTPTEVREQWRSILARPPRPDVEGFRQERFTPVETILCLSAMLVVDSHRYGGSTNHLAPTPVSELARLFQRTPSSILAKQNNLDGSRPNGARHEVETASILLSDPSRLMASYAIIVDGARHAGIGDERLPDFLGFETSAEFNLVGQEELVESEIEEAVEPILANVAGQMGGLPEIVTERLLVAAARIGQHRFAQGVLANFDHSCGFCGMRPGRELERRGLLIASHIKPWRDSTGHERVDVRNGIAACPSHDAAFDGGLLWVNGGYRIHLSHALADAARSDVGMSRSFGHPPIGEALHLPTGAIPPGHRYLEWHRTNVAAA